MSYSLKKCNSVYKRITSIYITFIIVVFKTDIEPLFICQSFLLVTLIYGTRFKHVNTSNRHKKLKY